MHVLNGLIDMFDIGLPLAIVIIVLIVCATLVIAKWLDTP